MPFKRLQRAKASFMAQIKRRDRRVQVTELTEVVGRQTWLEVPDPSCKTTIDILRTFASLPIHTVLDFLQTSPDGLTSSTASERLACAGPNVLSSSEPPTWWQLLFRVLPNPFNILLTLLAIISVATPEPEWSTFVILVVMVVASCALQFWQEYGSNNAVIKLQASISAVAQVRRQMPDASGDLRPGHVGVPSIDLVPGDILRISPGDSVPADCMLVQSSSLQVSESSLTGETDAVKKTANAIPNKEDIGPVDMENVLFAGTTIVSGSGEAVAVRTGDNVFIASLTQAANKKQPPNSFQRGIRKITYMMMAFTFVMAPIVCVISGVVTHNWRSAALFALSVAVGLVPEMLPAIVNANLARGAHLLAKNGAIVKRLDAIENLGGMSVLCSDKTGTLTMDEVALYDHLDCAGQQDTRVLHLAYANAANQSGTLNCIDRSIAAFVEGSADKAAIASVQKIGEIPFTFETRRSSVIIREANTGKPKLICKGAFEEVLSQCAKIRQGEEHELLTRAGRDALSEIARQLNVEGYRVLLVATKELTGYDNDDGGNGEELIDSKLVAEGFLTFLDPPKPDAATSISKLQSLGVEVKILTGDSLGVALKVCNSLGINSQTEGGNLRATTGTEIARVEGTDEFDALVRNCTVFAKLTPSQKADIIVSLKKADACVGMLGDGVNDCVALKLADVGISVDSGSSAAKDGSDVILTKKELDTIVDAVRIGRITHGNTIKYIKMVASSNFGNVFSILIASAWLPFSPMTALQILVQNLLYDISQVAIPWDRLDEEYIRRPRKWNAADLFRFMAIFGPTSSIIDMCTFCLGWFYYGIRTADNELLVARFHTHWFLEGLLTQTLIVHLLRTSKVPIFQSRAARPLVGSTVIIMSVGVGIVYIPPIRNALNMVSPAPSFMGFLAAELFVYCVAVQLLKVLYIRWFKTWL